MLHPNSNSQSDGRGKKGIFSRGFFSTPYVLSGIILFDLLLLFLFIVMMTGGVSFSSKRYLRHSADLRRILLLLGGVGFFFKLLREQSLILRAVMAFNLRLKRPTFRWGILLTGACFALFLAILQTRALRVTLWDVGIFHQILWSLSQGLGFQSSLSGAGNSLLDHFSPSLILLVPFFKAFGGSPYFLPVVQVILLFGGGAAWIFFAERVPDQDSKWRSTLAGSTVLFFLGMNSIWVNLRWGFHENALAFFSLSWFFSLIFLKMYRRLLLGVLFLVIVGSKEILLLDGAFVCGVAAYLGRKKRWTQWLLPFAIGSMLLVGFALFETAPHPPSKNYFSRYYSYLGSSLSEVLTKAYLAPYLIFKTVGLGELLRYFWTVLSSWLFLPLLAIRMPSIKEVRNGTLIWLWTLLPSLGSAALATYPPLRDSRFHYVLELWPLLALLTIASLAQLKSEKLVLAWVFIQCFRLDYDPWSEMREAWYEGGRLQETRSQLAQILSSEAVAADELSGTWVCNRSHLTRLPDLSGDPTFLILNQVMPEEVKTYLSRHSYQTVWQSQGWTGIQILDSNLN